MELLSVTYTFHKLFKRSSRVQHCAISLKLTKVLPEQNASFSVVHHVASMKKNVLPVRHVGYLECVAVFRRVYPVTHVLLGRDTRYIGVVETVRGFQGHTKHSLVDLEHTESAIVRVFFQPDYFDYWCHFTLLYKPTSLTTVTHTGARATAHPPQIKA